MPGCLSPLRVSGKASPMTPFSPPTAPNPRRASSRPRRCRARYRRTATAAGVRPSDLGNLVVAQVVPGRQGEDLLVGGPQGVQGLVDHVEFGSGPGRVAAPPAPPGAPAGRRRGSGWPAPDGPPRRPRGGAAARRGSRPGGARRSAWSRTRRRGRPPGCGPGAGHTPSPAGRQRRTARESAPRAPRTSPSWKLRRRGVPAEFPDATCRARLRPALLPPAVRYRGRSLNWERPWSTPVSAAWGSG